MKNLDIYVDLLRDYTQRMNEAQPGGPFPADRVVYLEARYGLTRCALLLPRLRKALVHNRSDFPLDAIDQLMESVDDDRIMMELDEQVTWQLLSESIGPLTALADQLAGRLATDPASLYRWQPPACPTDTLACVREKRDAILAAAAQYGVTHVRVFGSVARGDDQPGSDIDFLATFPENLDWKDEAHLAGAIKRIVGREIDLVSDRNVAAQIRDNVFASAVEL